MEQENTAVNNQASATGEENTSTKSFEEKAMEILNSIAGEFEKQTSSKEEETTKEVSSKNETSKEISSKEEKNSKEISSKEEIKEETKEEPKIKEENKIPYSRLQKVIEQRNEAREKVNSLTKELEDLKQKLRKEQDRIENLSEDEKEEYEAYKRLGIETREDRLLDKIETLEKRIQEYEEKIKFYEEEENKEKISKLQARIEELTREYDGSNGLPKFDIEELIEFGKKENYMPDDPLKLYNLKYQNEILALKYKAEKTNSEIDKGNREQFAPLKKTRSFDDPDFDQEALNIINSIT